MVEERLRAGERLVGVKVGLTSVAKQRQLGLHEPVYGWLTDAMVMRSPARVDLGRQIHPRVEPEIGFRLGDGLRVEGAFPAFEIVDSRYEGFKFGMADVIADNTSAAGVVMGELDAGTVDLPSVRCSLRTGGEEVATATGADVLGDPKRALAWVVEQAERAGRPLRPGMIVLSGGMTDFIPLRAGELVEADFDPLGTISISASQ